MNRHIEILEAMEDRFFLKLLENANIKEHDEKLKEYLKEIEECANTEKAEDKKEYYSKIGFGKKHRLNIISSISKL